MQSRDSISRRLQRVVMLTTAAVLALTCAMFIFFEWRNSLAAEKLRALSTARITADGSSAMMAFGSQKEAEKLLATFRADPDVLGATLYKLSGEVFADYQESATRPPANQAPRPDGLYVQSAKLSVYHPVSERGRRFGTLCLQVDLRPMMDRIIRYAWAALLIFGGALVAAFFIGRTLQRSVSRPILALAGTAQSISKHRDYSVRAQRAQGGELEILTTAFNEMLEEIQRQQRALAQEKELLATTLASIGDAVIATNDKGEVRFLNAEAERLTGWKTAQAVGQPLPAVFRIINEVTRQPVENPVEKVLRDGGVVGLANHTVLVANHGTETPIDDSAAPIRQPNGPLFGVVLVFRDVTEQRQAQEATARLAAVVSSSADAIITKNLDGVIRTWNASAQHLFGYTAAEIIGKPARLLFPPDRVNEEDDILARLRQGLPAERLESVRLRKDGSRIRVSVSVSPLANEEGDITGASTIMHDITELAEAREALVREKELLATTLASIGDAVIVTDERGIVTFLNGEAEHLTGWRLPEASGRPLPEVFRIINEQTRHPVENPVDKVLRLGEVVGLANHTVLLAKNGGECPIDDSAAPIRQPDGPVRGVVLVFRDFTQRKAAEARIAADLEAMTRLHQVGTLLARSGGDADECLQEIVAAAIALTGANRGNLQLLDDSGALHIAAQRGFSPSFLSFFAGGQARIASAADAALQSGSRVVVDDITRSPVFAGSESLRVLLDAGVRAVQSTPLTSSAGKVLGVLSTHFSAPGQPADRELRLVDILARQAADYLERKQAEQTQARYLGMIDSGFDAIIVRDTHDRITGWNRGAQELYGWSKEEALGQVTHSLFKTEFPNPQDLILETVSQKGRWEGELRHLRKDGRPITVFSRWTREENARSGSILEINMDISERKRTEEQIARNQQTFFDLVERAPFGIYIVNSQFRIQQMNAGARAGAFQNVNPLIGRDFAQAMRILWPEPVASEIIGIFRHTLATGEPYYSRDFFNPRADVQQTEAYEWELHRLTLADGTEGVICYYFDSTRLRQAEQALREAHAQLADRAVHLEKLVEERTGKLREMINEMQHVSYAIVHDMRAPLRAMSTFASAVEEHVAASPDKPVEVLDFCRRIVTAASRLDKLIQDSLSYTKSVLREVPLQPVDLGRLVKGLLETYPNLQPDKADITIEDPLPVVFGEESLLTQCFSNLLGNAVKFVRPGVRPKIHVRTQALEGLARIMIEDNGIGIPSEAQSRLFGMFQRLTAEYEGTGIGLAIVRKVTERMGGRVGADSEAGKGSRFWVELKTVGGREKAAGKASI